MKITKFGHCCLLVEEKGLRILTDPGSYSVVPADIKDVDIILITHEHADHFHIESLAKVLKMNPRAKIITNKSVGKLLDKESISYEVVEDGQNKTVEGVLIEGFGNNHNEIYKAFGLVQNTGYFIANQLFYPGDAFYNPKKKIDILALPVAGPWCKIKDSVKYALAVKPRVAFPVHDGSLKIMGGNHKVPEIFLKENGIDFIIPENGKVLEL